MSYDTPRERRWHAWCRAMEWQPTAINYGKWLDMGEPAPRDLWKGTELDRLVCEQLGLPFGEAS